MLIIKIVLLLVAMLFAFYLFFKPRILTAITTFFMVFQLDWFVRYLDAPAKLNKVVFLFVLLLALRLFIDFISSRIRVTGIFIKIYISLYFFITLLAIISCLYNGESLVFGLYELRYFYISIILLFAYHQYLWKDLTFDYFIKSLVWLGMIQIPFAIIQNIAAGGGSIRSLDSVTGTYGSYIGLVSCQVICIGLVLMDKMLFKKDTIKVNGYLVSLFLMMPLLLSKSRSATIYVVLISLSVLIYVIINKRDFKSLVIKPLQMLIILSISGLLFYQIFWKDNYDMSLQFNPEYVVNYYMREGRGYEDYIRGADTIMGRGMAVYKSVTLIFESFVTSLIGYGSGSTSNSYTFNVEGKLFFHYGPLAGLGRNEYSKTITELGLLGLSFFIFMLIIIKVKLKKFFPKQRRVLANYYVLMVSMLILSFYGPTFSSPFFSFFM